MSSATDNAAGFHANLIRLWRAGRREEVEGALRRISNLAYWRLLLEAVGHIRRFERDGVAVSPPCGAVEQLVVLHAILDFGHIDVARAYVAGSEIDGSAPAGLTSLRLLLANMPDDPVSSSIAPFADDLARDIQIVSRPGADGVLFVFTSGFHKFHVPLNLMHRWFCNLGVSIVYLRDFNRLFFLQGIRSLGDGTGAALRGLREIAARLGVSRIGCIGASSGSYGALRHGLYLGANSVLCLAGPTMFDESIPGLVAQERRLGPFAEPIDTARLDLAVLYGEATRPPRVRMIFGADHENDVCEAENMGHLPHVELLPLPGHASHAVVPRLVTDGTFRSHLEWATRPRAPFRVPEEAAG